MRFRFLLLFQALQKFLNAELSKVELTLSPGLYVKPLITVTTVVPSLKNLYHGCRIVGKLQPCLFKFGYYDPSQSFSVLTVHIHMSFIIISLYEYSMPPLVKYYFTNNKNDVIYCDTAQQK